MDSSLKRVIKQAEEQDFISNLPDCVLSRILSKLPTKFAVGTAILSTRWKHLFALIPEPELEFNNSLILHPQNQNDAESDSKNRATSFANFTHWVLNVILKEVPFFEKFTLKCTQKYETVQIIGWIESALNHDISALELELDFYLDDQVLLCDLLDYWECLLSLVLCMPENFSITFTLPNLCILVLKDIHFDEFGISVILSGCPKLIDLSMHRCLILDTDLEISSHSLKNLLFENCFWSVEGGSPIDYVEFDTPALEELVLRDCLPNSYCFKNIDSVNSVVISFSPMEGTKGYDSLEYNQHAVGFVEAFSRVKNLFLWKDTISALQKSSEQMPVFSNLTALHMGGFDINGWKLLPKLLDNAPNLQLLDICGEFYEENGYEIFKSHLSDKIPDCLVSTLKKIRFSEFKGKPDEILLISYFLEAGKVLNKLEITCDLPLETEKSILRDLDYVPTISEFCEVLFRMNRYDHV